MINNLIVSPSIQDLHECLLEGGLSRCLKHLVIRSMTVAERMTNDATAPVIIAAKIPFLMPILRGSMITITTISVKLP